jgi:hypothetical protein
VFEAYLDAHNGYSYQYEPDLRSRLGLTCDPPKLFDYLIEHGSLQVVCEVRAFESHRIRNRLLASGGYAALSEKEVFGTQRAGLVEKACELACLDGVGVPLVIVLSQGRSDAQLDELHVTSAMFGNARFIIPIHSDRGGAAGEGHILLDGYGAFRQCVRGEIVNPHPHVSAVVTLHQRTYEQDWLEAEAQGHRLEENGLEGIEDYLRRYLRTVQEAREGGEIPEGSYQWVEVYELDGESATPLPREIFNGPRDRRYGFISGSSYGEVAA